MRTAGQPVIRHEYRWPNGLQSQLPALPGYILSSFSPLAAAVAGGCLSEYYARLAVSAASRQRTGVLVVSRSSDLVSAEHVTQTVAAGRRLGPLFFFQSAPNSVVGQITAHWGLGGPVVCMSPIGDPLADGMAEAALMLSDGDADAVLLILIEQDPRGCGDPQQSGDRAHALLLAEGEEE